MQLKSSLISFNHHFDSPVIPTKIKNNRLISRRLFFCLGKVDSDGVFFKKRQVNYKAQNRGHDLLENIFGFTAKVLLF